LELQAEIYDIDVNLDVCGRCGVCVAICPYEAPSMITIDEEIDLVIDVNKCKRCGICVAACPVNAILIKDDLAASIDSVLAGLG
jgi:heterodisulfide reductase subunit A